MTEHLIAWSALILSATSLGLSCWWIRSARVTVGLWDIQRPVVRGDAPGEEDYEGRD